jgi:hypothetical protein
MVRIVKVPRIIGRSLMGQLVHMWHVRYGLSWEGASGKLKFL